MKLSPWFLIPWLVVFCFVPMTGFVKLETTTIHNQRNNLALLQTGCHLIAIMANLNRKRSKQITQMSKARNSNIKSFTFLKIFEITGNLSYSPIEKSIKNVNPFNVNRLIISLSTAESFFVRVFIDEQFFQITMRKVKAQLTAFLQALIISVQFTTL